MGKLNLLSADFSGKVGQVVGAKWKGISTLRTYKKPNNPNTSNQQTVRGGFGAITSFVARFSDQLRYLSALPARNMSVRNAIIKLNKAMVKAGTLTKADLLISKGGLQKPIGFTATASATGIAIAWDDPTATNFTAKAKAIAVAVVEDKDISVVAEGLVADKALTLPAALASGDSADVYLYFIDYRGSNKVGSDSVYSAAVVA